VNVPLIICPFAFAGELIECSFQRASVVLLFDRANLADRFDEPGSAGKCRNDDEPEDWLVFRQRGPALRE
jgi:hypothetical protein